MSATAVLLHPPDRRLFADDITFQVDVSRTYRNKEGYDAGGYKLNISFQTESHTGASFIDDVIQQGWPYTMVHQKRSPEETGAAARKVVTPKHIENFVSSQLLTGDDDSKTPGVIDWWWRDPFFSRYGWFFAESVNSVTGEAEKGHPTLLFDEPITDPALYKDCLRAFCFAYPRLDHLTNIDRTIYNAQEARVHILGNICPFPVFEQEILTPWRIAEAEKRAAIEAEQARRLAAHNGNGHAASSNHLHAYLAGYTRWMFDKVASKHKGDNRNMAIYWAGRTIAGIEATPWARLYLDAVGDVHGRIVDAAAANGYLAEYAHNDPVEVVRIFERGRAAGGEPLDEPEARPMPVTVSRGANGAAPGTAVTQVAATSGFRLDDTGNAERFNSQHGDKVRYDHTRGKWLLYNRQYWEADETGQVDQLAKVTVRSLYDEAARAAAAGNDNLAAELSKSARTSGSASKRAAMLTLVKSEPPIAITHKELNRDPYLVACTNGTIDLRTGQLRPADPADLITRCLPVAYDPAASCPLWLAFLGRIMPETANRVFLQKAVGVALSGDMVQSLFFLYGMGANGKSTFVETILSLLGEYAAKTNAETLLQQDRRGVPNDVAALVGKRLVVASELPDGRRLNESQVKDLTGGDSITARFLNQEFFTFRPEFKLWMYGNHKPVITGTDDGIWRRIRLIPFTVQIPESEQDSQLAVKLRAELPGILAWAVEGWRLYQAEGLNPPADVTQATAAYRSESDALGQFLDDCTIEGQGYIVGSSGLYKVYSEWTATNGMGTLSNVRFARALQERGFTKEREMGGVFWHGLGLLTADSM